MGNRSFYDWDQLIQSDRVHREIYTNPEIFELELERIYESNWVYIGHASQAPARGDYFTTEIGRQPVVMVRHADDIIRVIHNRCPHKGAEVVPPGCGNSKGFRCSYHGWRFDTDGALLAIPMREGYEGTSLCPSDTKTTSMQTIKHVANYRGFIFASLTKPKVDFDTWIRGVSGSIDNMIDRSPEGEMEIVRGSFRYLMNCNWKFHVENLNDLMHPMVAHQSASQAGKMVSKQNFDNDSELPSALEVISPFTNKYSFFDEMGISVFENGHSYSGGKVSIHSDYSDVPGYREKMERSYGKQRVNDIFSENRHNTVVYPNLTIKGAIQTIRVCRPLAVDRTLVESYVFRLKGAPEQLLHRSIQYSNLVNSSGGLVQVDDHECYRRLQSGLHSKGLEWVNMQRYMGQDMEGDGYGSRAIGTSDAAFRNQYQAWKKCMSDEEAHI